MDYDGFVVVVGSRADAKVWVKVSADGVALNGGGFLQRDRIVIQATQSVTVQTGNERNTMVGVQGDIPRPLSTRKDPATWSVQEGGDPVRIP